MHKFKAGYHITSAHRHSLQSNSGGLHSLYEQVSVIDTDSLGPLLNATHTKSAEKVAVKVLSPPLSVDKESLLAVTHPYIIEVLDVLPMPNEGTMVVLQPPRGICTHRVLSIQQRLKPHHAVHITLQVLEILKFLHDKNLLHKSISSKSVFLLRKSTNRIDVSLVYLGIGGNGSALNDPGYLSPEQVAEIGHNDRMDDLWATGVLLYEMVYGALPFMGKTTHETLGRILIEEVSSPPHLIVAHPGLQRFIQRALTKKYDERYQDAASMIADLKACFSRSSLPTPTGSSFPPDDISDPDARGWRKVAPPTLSAPPSPRIRAHAKRDDSDHTNPCIETSLIAQEERQQVKASQRERELQQYVQTIQLETAERQTAKQTIDRKKCGGR